MRLSKLYHKHMYCKLYVICVYKLYYTQNVGEIKGKNNTTSFVMCTIYDDSIWRFNMPHIL